MVQTVRLGSLLDTRVGGLEEFAQQSLTHQRNILKAMSLQTAAPDTDDAMQVADVGGSRLSLCTPDLAPSSTATRTASKGFWLLNRNRPLSMPELMRLQGMDPERMPGWEAVVSERQMGHIVGSAINVKLSARWMREVLLTIGRPVK